MPEEKWKGPSAYALWVKSKEAGAMVFILSHGGAMAGISRKELETVLAGQPLLLLKA